MENDVMEASKSENEVNYKVKDLSLAESGQKKIEWAESRMPVMMALKKKYSESKPLKGMRIAGCLHVTKETAVLIKTLIAAGADISWSGCNPLSTQDDIAAALAKDGISIYAWHGMNVNEFYWAIEKTLEFKPTLTLDDGADLIFTIHNKHPELAKEGAAGYIARNKMKIALITVLTTLITTLGGLLIAWLQSLGG